MTSSVKNLADYSLRSGLIQSDGGVMAQNDFLLPDASVAPYGFIVVSGKPFADLYDGPSLKRLGSPSATLYFVADGGPGAVQLRSSGGVPVDTVVFGAFSAPGWQGAPASLPAEFGRTLARRLEQGDTDTAADFAGVDVATPGGPNDAFDATDSDGDGIPDSAERPGGQLAGLPLYDWGARTNQRDVFVEVDWMKPDGGSGFDPGLLPRRDALQRVTDVMLTHGIHLHFDVGALFGAGVMDLGGGNELPFGCTLTLAGTVGPTSLFALKAAAFDLRRLASFHYLVFGNSLADVACGGVGATGRAELPGDDVAITLGNRGYAVSPVNQLNRLVNAMSSTVMHELGHNFGLRHGGDVDANFKPNYLSVMNYLYQLEGLPQIGTAEGDRYYYFYGGLYGLCTGPPAIASRNSLTRNAFSAPGVFSLDYSDGKSLPLDKAALDETKGMGRAGSTAVDWSYDGAIQAGAVSANVDALGSALPVCPRNSPSTGVVTDHDDWAALNLPFNRTPLGSALGKRAPRSPRAGIDLIGDHQPWSIETAQP